MEEFCLLCFVCCLSKYHLEDIYVENSPDCNCRAQWISISWNQTDITRPQNTACLAPQVPLAPTPPKSHPFLTADTTGFISPGGSFNERSSGERGLLQAPQCLTGGGLGGEGFEWKKMKIISNPNRRIGEAGRRKGLCQMWTKTRSLAAGPGEAVQRQSRQLHTLEGAGARMVSQEEGRREG